MRVSLLAYTQLQDERPAHFFPKHWIVLLLTTRLNGKPLGVELIPGKLYQLNTEESLHDTKLRFRTSQTWLRPRSIPRLNPSSSYLVMTLQSYPEPNRGTTVHAHAAFLRECQQARKRKAAKLANR